MSPRESNPTRKGIAAAIHIYIEIDLLSNLECISFPNERLLCQKGFAATVESFVLFWRLANLEIIPRDRSLLKEALDRSQRTKRCTVIDAHTALLGSKEHGTHMRQDGSTFASPYLGTLP